MRPGKPYARAPARDCVYHYERYSRLGMDYCSRCGKNLTHLELDFAIAELKRPELIRYPAKIGTGNGKSVKMGKIGKGMPSLSSLNEISVRDENPVSYENPVQRGRVRFLFVAWPSSQGIVQREIPRFMKISAIDQGELIEKLARKVGLMPGNLVVRKSGEGWAVRHMPNGYIGIIFKLKPNQTKESK